MHVDNAHLTIRLIGYSFDKAGRSFGKAQKMGNGCSCDGKV